MKPTLYLATLSLLLSACGPKAESESATTAETAPATSAALQQVFASDLSGEPAAIHLARTTAKPGDAITLKGRVMGNLHPFVEGRSIFILGDTDTLTACSDKPGDGCETPWDTCCDTPEVIKTGTATIQVVDADGKVLKEGIEGVEGLQKLAYVVVSGTVAPSSTEELLLVNAQAIQVEDAKRP